MDRNLVLAKRILTAKLRRDLESPRIVKPLPAALAFHRSRCRRRLLVGSNRSSKTFHAALEIARIVSGSDKKFGHDRGVIIAVGKDSDHVGDPMWTKLSRPGEYKIIFDERENRWRAVRPDPNNPRELDPYDLANRDRWRDGEPLLPPRLVDWKRISWYLAKQNLPRRVPLKTGWEIRFYSSEGAPKRGIKAAGAWFDEEIINRLWYSETIARLVDQRGFFIWSATPQSATEQLLALHSQAEQGQGVEEFFLHIDDNPYLDREAKQEFLGSLTDPEEIEVRYHGRWLLLSLRVYPEFDERTHLVEDEPGDDWTRYVAVDPGFQTAAAVMLAVPPPGEKPYAGLVCGEVYLRDCTPDRMAEALRDMLAGHKAQRFLIDYRMARQKQMGTGLTVAQHYAEALAEVGLSSEETGSDFDMASDDVEGRTQSLKRLLVGRSGGPTWMFHARRVPNLVRELKAQYWRLRKPDQRQKGNDHAVHCLEYLAAEDLPYVEPPPPEEKASVVWEMYQEKQRNRRRREAQAALWENDE